MEAKQIIDKMQILDEEKKMSQLKDGKKKKR